MADPITLPPLPEPAFSLRWERGEYKVSPPMDDCDCYTTDQLRARDLEVARLVLEAAANLCDEQARAAYKRWRSGESAYDDGGCDIANMLALSIRALEVRHHE